MLSLRLSLEDVVEPWVVAPNSVRFGTSSIEKFGSRLITMSARAEATGGQIWIGEDDDPFRHQSGALPAADDYRDFLLFEGIRISIALEEGRAEVELARTAKGACPVYLAANGATLVASWKFEEAVEAIAPPRPNIEACRLYLEHGQRQVRHMIIDGVFMLWPGESATFDGDGLRFREVDSPDIVLPGTLAESGRATDAFLQLIGDSLRHNLAKSAHPLIELSGGLDSSCVAVAAAAASAKPPISSYAVIHQGAMGLQQRRRRRELVELLGLTDFEFPSFEHPPFASLEVEECTFTPYDDMYRLPCVHAVDAHPVQDIDLIITGIGGDELTKEKTFLFRREWEVRAGACASAIVSAVGRADMFMRRGIWPVHPLVDPAVIDFCRALPEKMRAGRQLNYLTLARAGLSDGFLYPRYYEHYGHVVRHEAAAFDFDEALAQSVVADWRIADISGLLARAREATLDGFSYALITELYLLLKLETVLRRYLA